MANETISLSGDLHFKIRFNTMHGDTDLYWRVIIGEQEYLVKTVHCKVDTWSDASFDTRANALKYHIAGKCKELYMDEAGKAVFL